VVRYIADNLGIGFDPQRFRVVGHLSELALGLLEIGMILNLRLEFGVFGQTPHFGGFRHSRCLGFGDVCFTVGQLVESFVRLHVEGHAARLAPETYLVPCLVKTLEFLGRVDIFITSRAQFSHFLSMVTGIFL